MSATVEQRLRLRRMCGLQRDDDTYSDAVLDMYIERYPHLDERGEEPYTFNTSTEPPTQEDNDDWIPTYDLNAAAADIWDEIAARLVSNFDFSAEGRSFQRSQAFQNAQSRARYYRSRRMPTTLRAVQWPKESPDTTPAWIGNLPEEDLE